MNGLPLGSAFGRALGARETWGNVEELLAVAIENIDATNRILYAANSKKGATQPKPIKVPRPSGQTGETDPVPKKRPATSEELARYFGANVRYTGAPKAGDSVPTAEGTK